MANIKITSMDKATYNGLPLRKITLDGVTVYEKTEQCPASIDFNATAGDNTLHLRNQTAGYDCTIHWGDGTDTVAPANGGNVIHNYATAGVRNITITGNSFAGFYTYYQAGREKYIVVYSMGKWEKDTMTDLTHCFFGCTSLTTLSADLFRYNTGVKYLYESFSGCTTLTTIPADLFRYNTALTDMCGCFSDCDSLTARADMFGADYANRWNGKRVTFSYFMYRDSFHGAQGTAPALWKFAGVIHADGAMPSPGCCFAGVGNSPASLSNYAEIPTSWSEAPSSN